MKEKLLDLITTDFVELYEDDTVNKSFDKIRNTGVNNETIYTCYVINQDRLLTGIITAKKLILSESNQYIGDIMNCNPIFAHIYDDLETIAGMFKKYGLLSMPIVDNKQHLIGIITVDDMMQVMEEESTEDIEKMNALAPSDEPYLRTGIPRLAKNRIIWLLILMLSATITGIIITGFEEAIAGLPLLVAFIPMLMDTGGNAGAQSSTLIIRGMAVGEIKLRDILRVLWRELRVAVLCGFVLCFINFVRIFVMNGKNIVLAAAVSITLFITILLAKSIGCLLPMLAKKIKIDPAIMAAPIITTIVDAVSLMIYFSIAKIFFSI